MAEIQETLAERRVWRMELPVRLPTTNQWQGKHWATKAREIEAWAWRMKIAVARAKIPRATGRRRVTIERWSPGNADPAAPYLTADKLILDNLKARKQIVLGTRNGKRITGWSKGPGAIVDDSTKWIELMPIRQPKGPFRIVIELEDIE